jgi:hypothetical protein
MNNCYNQWILKKSKRRRKKKKKPSNKGELVSQLKVVLKVI